MPPPTGPLVRPATAPDRDAWLGMRDALWPGERDEHAAEIDRFLRGERTNPLETLLAFSSDDAAIGFVELSLREFAEGCASSPVCYVEGWFVAAEHRRSGVGAALIRAAADWGRARGAREMASDVELDNEISLTAHRALGFDEVARAVLLRRDL